MSNYTLNLGPEYSRKYGIRKSLPKSRYAISCKLYELNDDGNTIRRPRTYRKISCVIAVGPSGEEQIKTHDLQSMADIFGVKADAIRMNICRRRTIKRGNMKGWSFKATYETAAD